MKLIYDKLNILIEPFSAVAFAGVLKEKEKFKKKCQKNHYSQTKKRILTQFINWVRNFIDNAE